MGVESEGNRQDMGWTELHAEAARLTALDDHVNGPFDQVNPAKRLRAVQYHDSSARGDGTVVIEEREVIIDRRGEYKVESVARDEHRSETKDYKSSWKARRTGDKKSLAPNVGSAAPERGHPQIASGRSGVPSEGALLFCDGSLKPSTCPSSADSPF
jgi:hypothetical protein